MAAYTTNEENNMKTLNDITLYDLMAEDLDIWVTRNNKFGFDLQIDDENRQIVDEKGIHPCAADSFADFCRRYLHTYDNAVSKEGI